MTALSKNDRAYPELRFPDHMGDWDNIRLKDTADIKRGAGSQYLTYVQTEDEGVRLIRIGDFLGNDPVFVEDTKDMERFRLQRNDILIAGTGATAGITFKVPEEFIDFAFSYNAPRIRVRDSDSDFVISYLKSEVVLRQQHRLFTGNAQPFLDTAAIGGFRMRIPTLPEQRKIADFLTAVDGRIGQLIQKKALLTDYKKGVMQQLFTQAIRFKDDHGNDFPDWEEKKLGEVCNCFSGGTPSSGKRDYYGGPIPFIRSAEIAAPKTALFLTEKGYSASAAKMVEEEDLLVALYGANSGEVGIARISGAINQAILCVRSKQSVRFLFFWLEYSKDSIVKTYLQGGQGNLSGKIIQSLKIGLPTIPEQTKIANFLSAIDRKIESVTSQITETQTFKRGLLQQMFV